MKVVAPSTPYDAKGLILSAIWDNNPVLFIEHKLLYGAASPGGGKALADTSMVDIGANVPEEAYTIPFKSADIKRQGNDVTVIATMLMLHRALTAAELLATEGIDVEVIDPRSLVPLDMDTITASLRKTHHAVVVSEDVTRAGAGAEIMARISEEAFYELDAPVRRLGTANTPIPFGPASEKNAIPQIDDIAEAIRRVLKED
jgi:pyruvate dehydrogenase E1 component beta subunit